MVAEGGVCELLAFDLNDELQNLEDFWVSMTNNNLIIYLNSAWQDT